MNKSTYVIEIEKYIPTHFKPQLKHQLCEVVMEGYRELCEEAKGGLTNHSPVEIVIRTMADFYLSMCNDEFGKTTVDFVKEQIPNACILVDKYGDDSGCDKIIFRAFVR